MAGSRPHASHEGLIPLNYFVERIRGDPIRHKEGGATMSNSLARTEPDIHGRGRSYGAVPVFDRLAELEKRVLAMDKHTESRMPLISPPEAGENHIAPLGNVPAVRMTALKTLDDFEARLPQLIENEVTARFQQMTATLQREVEETNIRAIENFVKNVQSKLVQRISLLEANMNKQAQTMIELRECSRRTEDNLIRLISGVERLARELPARMRARS